MSNSNLPERDEKQINPWMLAPGGWFLVAGATYIAMQVLVQTHPDWSPLLKSTLALAPALPGWLYLRKILQVVRGMDELQRRINLEGLLFGALGTVIVSTIINVFNAQGLVGKWPAHGLELGGTYMTMFILWNVGLTIANRRYR